MHDETVYRDGGASEVYADYQALGNFEASSVAGTVSGRWLIDLHSVASTEEVASEAYAIGVGVLRGSTFGVDLELDTLTVSEPSIGMSLTFTAEELPTPGAGRLEVTGGDCNTVWGDWVIEFPSHPLEGQFSAFRVGVEADDESVAASRRASQEQLSARGRSLLTDIRAGNIDVESIRELLQAVEGALAYGGRGSCGGDDSGSFRAATTELIDSMLFELAGGADELDVESLIELIVAGFRSGSFFADPEARDFWLGVYDEAVDAALAGGDRPTLARFSAASRLLGFDEQAAVIDALLADLGS